ncbi:zeaxanthin epoxidase [Populus alba x Populus x berolinensis]|uniref:Zeaxanthin epoxidase, chloroplastic n=1 Tax=Populus alba x Populus x berolinensis TaxID=444605 RepID=A0AAD6VUI1_9ROSI|nr:zeaxanthin epoxidase [Populus alba x Populus x berolinensis]
MVFEKDLSAVRGEGQYRGPIQIQSNALAALEAIDLDVAEEVLRAGCITGDRINGLVDGVSGTWYVKFDTFTPAAERGLPVTRVISRMTLQQILARSVGDDMILNDSNVVSFQDDGDKCRFTVVLENGQQYEGDLLVGADGIWSKVSCIFGSQNNTSFLQTWVAGKMQWYAFHKEPPGGMDAPHGKKDRLLKIFEGWCDNVIDLLLTTNEDAILRRDIYDREPIITWGKGRVTLLGDSVHAMQPNMGQGGCMAIEDSYQLASELERAWKQSIESGTPVDVISSLRSYENARKTSSCYYPWNGKNGSNYGFNIQGVSGCRTWSTFLTNFRIPHPGRVGGRFFIDIAMPVMLDWVLGGNSSKLEGRSLSCRLSDKANDQLRRWFVDDDALERSLNGEWFLLPCGNDAVASQPIGLSRDENKPCVVGSVSQEDFPGMSIVIPAPQVSKTHARITCKDGAFYLIDLRSEHGTFITDIEGRRYRAPPNFPTRFHPSDMIEFGSDKKVIFRVKVMRSPPKISEKDEGQVLQSV